MTNSISFRQLSFSAFLGMMLMPTNIAAQTTSASYRQADSPPDWIAAVGDGDNLCAGFDLVVNNFPNGQGACDCPDRTVRCSYAEVCPPGAGLCATTDLTMDLVGADLAVSSCADFRERYQRTCVDCNVVEGVIATCAAQYDSQNCTCTPCANGTGVEVDCSGYDEGAVTGCQIMAPFSPMIPDFAPSVADLVGQQMGGEQQAGEQQDSTPVGAENQDMLFSTNSLETAAVPSAAVTTAMTNGMIFMLLAISAHFLM